MRASVGPAPPRGSLAGHREESPLAGHTLQCVHAAIGEGEARPGDEVLDRGRNQDFAGIRERRDACCDMHGDSADVIVYELALAGVQTGARFETESTRLVHDRLGAADCSSRPVEGGEESVAHRLDLTSAESLELTTDLRLV